MLILTVIENYINGWRTDLSNEDGKMLAFDNTETVKEGIVNVINTFIEKCPEYRKEALEAMYEEMDTSLNTSINQNE